MAMGLSIKPQYSDIAALFRQAYSHIVPPTQGPTYVEVISPIGGSVQRIKTVDGPKGLPEYIPPEEPVAPQSAKAEKPSVTNAIGFANALGNREIADSYVDMYKNRDAAYLLSRLIDGYPYKG
ncbi:hypothetical protein KKA47_06600 [bacterium]|nr:hypothetical protein [bacterium]